MALAAAALEAVRVLLDEVAEAADDLAVTGYWGGPFAKENKEKVLAWMNASEQRWKDGLEPTPYSPTCDALRRQNLRAWVCVHTIVQLLPGKREAFLAAVGDTLTPLLQVDDVSHTPDGRPRV